MVANDPLENAWFQAGVHWASLALRPSLAAVTEVSQAVLTAAFLS